MEDPTAKHKGSVSALTGGIRNITVNLECGEYDR